MHTSPSAFDLKVYRFAFDNSSLQQRESDLKHPGCPYHSFASLAWEVACFHYHFGKPADAREALKQSLEDSTAYFFGDWRLTRPVDPVANSEKFRPLPNEQAAREYTWNPRDFKQPLAGALALGDRKIATKLAKYLIVDRVPEAGADVGIEHTGDALDIYEAYAEMILDKPVRITLKTPYRKKVPHKRLQLMRECVYAATAKDVSRCLETLKAFAKYYRTREIEKGEAYTSWISTDATILYHVMAKRLGSPLELDREERYHVMVLGEG